VRDYSEPAVYTVADTGDLTDPVFRVAAETPDHVTYRIRSSEGGWSDLTASRFADEVVAVAKGLLAAGINPGDRVALMSRTRYEWSLIDYAIWSAGGVTVPVYETSSPEQVRWILGDSGAVACLVETDAHAHAVEEIRGDLPDLRELWTIDPGEKPGAVEALVAAGKDRDDAEVADRRAGLRADDVATIIYTSGTTGRPKGCVLTHRNILTDIGNAIPGLEALFHEGAASLLFLPLAHSFARLIQVGAMQARVTLGHTADVKQLMDDLASFQPTFILAVPRVFEKVFNAAKQKAHADGKGRIFDKAADVAIRWSEAQASGGPGLGLRTQHGVFERLVYGRLRAALGGRCEYAISGGAPLGLRLAHFFNGAGLLILEGYGLTETSPATAVNTPDHVKLGTVGRPIPSATVRIADNGEIMIGGDHVFREYWHNPEATKAALQDGYFLSGDLGEIDDDGYLRVTGRSKELIVTAGGKNVAPAVLEERIRAHALVSQSMVIGDGKPFIGCLVTIDEDAFGPWKAEHGKPADASAENLVDDPDLRATLQEAVDDANRAVSRAEGIRVFRILPRDFTEETGELTPSLKLKRAVVEKEYADEIAAIYS
jgi:long-chain acyl-CoA synthetase